MIDVSVLVPEARLADFYAWYGAWLAGGDGAPADSGHVPAPIDWSDNAEDEALAKPVWEVFSGHAKAVFGTLMDHPGEKFTGEDLAERHSVPNGKAGVAGVLGWPGRHCLAVGRVVPCRKANGPEGGSASYWMEPATAALFRRVRDAQ